MIFHVAIEQDEDGWFLVECPSRSGCVSQGRTDQEAIENIKEAITAWLWAEDQKTLFAPPPSRANEAIVVEPFS
jgi:predicted RNase H-like HicB family nuclease